jgi:hypothetical protein
VQGQAVQVGMSHRPTVTAVAGLNPGVQVAQKAMLIWRGGVYQGTALCMLCAQQRLRHTRAAVQLCPGVEHMIKNLSPLTDLLQGPEADCWPWWREEPLDSSCRAPGPGVCPAHG